MDSGRGKTRTNVEGDRLSNLPDDLIHKILSFIDIREAIGSGVLSSRWKFIWTSMPYLNFSTEDFSTLPKFSKFVTHVLTRRNNLTDVYSVKLKFRGKASQVFVKRILNYAFCHNIQQLNVVWLLENHIEFPLSLFSSQSLKHLSFAMQFGRSRRNLGDSCFITPTSIWELPTLTTLDLHSVTLCDNEADNSIGVFSKCANLKNLTLKDFKMMESSCFKIFHPRLSNLTLENSRCSVKVINVDAPQLENLTIRSCYYAEFAISAPDLVSLLYKGSNPLHLSTEGFHSLEKADICISSPRNDDAHQIVRLLQQLHNVHFLTLNLEIVEFLSSSEDLMLHQPSPFVNLKSLKIYPERTESWWKQADMKVTLFTELKSYFLDGSQRSTFTMVSREESQAHNLMAELRMLLDKEKDSSKTNAAHLEREKTPLDSGEPKNGGNMAQIKGGWENLAVQFWQKKEQAFLIISNLQRVEELLTKLPASKKAKIQSCFSSLCAEAEIAISQITDCIKIQCDENQSRSSVWFRELAKTLEPSSSRL